MRKWHRWLSVIFGVFMLWIAATGVLSQIVPLVQNGGFEKRSGPPPGAAMAATPGGPGATPAQPPRKLSLVGTLHHLHSGESFGPLGQIISILSGLALLFFAGSGLWLYIQMWRGRLVKVAQGKQVRGGRFFWD